MKHLLLCLAVSVLAYTAPLYAENLFYEFGPKTDTVILFTASVSADNQDNSATMQLKDFAQELQKRPPDIRIIIVITQHDSTDLPPDIPVRRLHGTQDLIKSLASYPNPIAVLITAGTHTSAKIIAGTNGNVAPSWLLQSVYNGLRHTGIPINFDPNTLLLHKLGWLEDDPALPLYNQADIPSIKIETAADISDFLCLFPSYLMDSRTIEQDKHYFAFLFRGALVITGEKTIVLIIIGAILTILCWLIMLSFVFGRKNEQHRHDLRILWWIPLYFFIVNALGFVIGSKITELVFALRFLSSTEMIFYPITALAVKYGIALFFMLIVVSLNIRIPLPRNRFIYGFLANTVCACNIFIFSTIDLSFAVFFLIMYLISLAAYQFKNTIIQTMFLIFLYSPLLPFLLHIMNNSEAVFPFIFALNTQPAILFIPFDLLLIRLLLSVEKQYGIKQWRLKAQAAISTAVLVTLLLWFFLMPDKTTDIHNNFVLMQKITQGQTAILKNYNGTQENAALQYRQHADGMSASQVEDSLIVGGTLDNYFERSIGTVSVRSSLKPEAIHVTIESQDGSALFEADQLFEKNSKGDKASFVSLPRPEMPFAIRFSGEKDAVLRITVQFWTRENPCGIIFEGEGNAPSFLLEIKKTLTIQAR
ncbi:MAG: hypothetical protein ACTTH7_02510 [Treponema sp.]